MTSNKKKILLIAYYFPPSKSIGAKRALSLYKTFSKAGFEVDVLSANWEGNKIPEINYIGKPCGLEVLSTKSRKKRIKIDPYFRSLDRSMISSFFFNSLRGYFIRNKTKKKYDVIISTYRPSCDIILGILFSKIYKAKLIVDLRDLVSNMGHKEKIFIVDSIDRFVDRLLISFADKIVTVTPTCKKKAEALYKREVELVMNGIENSNNVIENNLKLKNEEVIIFYSGSINSTRKLDRICSFIKRDKIRIRLVIASGTNPMDYGGQPEIVDWVGYISQEEVVVWQNKADYLLLLDGPTESAIENAPAKLFEYLSIRKPILADCHPKSDSISILNETRTGKAIDTYSKFSLAIESDWFDKNADLSKYYRENQNRKFISLVNSL